MKQNTNKSEQQFLSCTVIADLKNKKLLLPKNTVENLHNLTCGSTEMYFKYKTKYPDFEEVIFIELQPIPLNAISS